MRLAPLLSWLHQQCPVSFSLRSALAECEALAVEAKLAVACRFHRLCFGFGAPQWVDPRLFSQPRLQAALTRIRHALPPAVLVERLDLAFFHDEEAHSAATVEKATAAQREQRRQHNSAKLRSDERAAESKRKRRQQQQGEAKRRRQREVEQKADGTKEDEKVQDAAREARVAHILQTMDSSLHNRWVTADIVPLAARLTLFLDKRRSRSAYWLLMMEVYCVNGDVWQPDTVVEAAQGDRDEEGEDEEDEVGEAQMEEEKAEGRRG